MNKPEIQKNQIQPIKETPFLSLYDFQYLEDKHYYVASRKKTDDLVMLKSDEEFRNLVPDAVTMIVVLNTDDGPKLLTFFEYRYPTGHFLLSPPAGLVDPEDRIKSREEAIYATAVRELFEETGITFKDGDTYRLLTPGVFSSPGMSDETSAVTLFVINHPDLSEISDKHTEGSEMFQGYRLFDREEVLQMIHSGTDPDGYIFSVQTWVALLYFVSDLWK